jgi:hypothetical protein
VATLPDYFVICSLEIGRFEIYETSDFMRVKAGEPPNVFAAPRMSDEDVRRWNVRGGEERMQRFGHVRESGWLTVEFRLPQSAPVIGERRRE